MKYDDEVLKAAFDADRGPTPEDLENAPLLQNWSLHREELLIHAVGECQDHPILAGPIIITSPILGMSISGGWLRSRARWYRLAQAAEPEEAVWNDWEVQAFLAFTRRALRKAARNADLADPRKVQRES